MCQLERPASYLSFCIFSADLEKPTLRQWVAGRYFVTGACVDKEKDYASKDQKVFISYLCACVTLMTRINFLGLLADRMLNFCSSCDMRPEKRLKVLGMRT